MKNRFWRRFSRWAAGTAVILGLLVIGAAPALALTGEIGLSAIDGQVGTTVTVNGSNFTEGLTYTVLFGGSAVTLNNSNNTVQPGGGFVNTFNVPNLPAGPYAVTATTASDASNTVTFRIKVIINPAITINSITGFVGDKVTVGGSGFTSSSTARILFDGAIIGDPVTTAAGGGLTATDITIPEAPAGTHTFSARDNSGTTSPTQNFAISPKIAITPTSGGVGDQVTVSGNGFTASQNLGIYFDGTLVTAGVAASAKGVLSSGVTFNIPAGGRGNHTIEVKGGTDSATATLGLVQKMTMQPVTGTAGTVVSVSGTGFTAGQAVSVKFNAASVTTTPPSLAVATDGSFSGSFEVSGGAAGTYAVEVSDGTLTSSQNFKLESAGTLEPKTGNVGTTVSVNATGFTPDATVTITFDSKEITTAKAAANGGFKASFNVPAVKGGDYQVAASDNTNSFSGTFTMESTAPPVPALTSLKDKARGSRTPTLQWGAVTDPSGVTYDFQLAADAGFATPLVDEKGLTDTRFVVTEAGKLEPAKKEAPYYWRVRAVDGASNASDWSAPFSFYTGISLSLPAGVIYALIAVGALLIGLIGFWLGRRSAYYS